MEMRFKIFRFDPAVDAEPYYRTYTVHAEPQERILDGLNRIRWEHDGTLAYRMSCAHGVCGSDGMKINGRCALACQTLIKDCQGNDILIEPLPGFRVMKDLIVDMEPFFRRIEEIRPYLTADDAPPEGERLQSPEDMKKLDRVIRCILCASCVGACPVTLENKNYVGPAPLVWAFRYVFDSRDKRRAERLAEVDRPDGVWSCVNHFECTRVCPKEIPVTKCINTLKQEIQKRKKD
jgi:succinate dehydrogenase / fumarate reductase iron-sulfur subunit